MRFRPANPRTPASAQALDLRSNADIGTSDIHIVRRASWWRVSSPLQKTHYYFDGRADYVNAVNASATMRPHQVFSRNRL